MTKVLIGTNSLSQNSVIVMGVGIPTEDSIVDYSYYR
jgi:hypothetical protein